MPTGFPRYSDVDNTAPSTLCSGRGPALHALAVPALDVPRRPPPARSRPAGGWSAPTRHRQPGPRRPRIRPARARPSPSLCRGAAAPRASTIEDTSTVTTATAVAREAANAPGSRLGAGAGARRCCRCGRRGPGCRGRSAPGCGGGPVAVAGVAQVALSWQTESLPAAPGAGRAVFGLAGAAGLAHLLGYNPFADPAFSAPARTSSRRSTGC